MTMCQSVISIESSKHLATEHRLPGERHVDALGGEERTVCRRQPFDDEVFEHELAVEQADAEPADVHRPPDALRPLALGEPAQARTEIDRQRRDNRHGKRHRQHGDAELREAEREVRSNALEAFESQRHD